MKKLLIKFLLIISITSMNLLNNQNLFISVFNHNNHNIFTALLEQ